MPARTGTRLGKQRRNLTLFGECLYTLCDYIDLSAKDLERLLEVSHGTLSLVTRIGASTRPPSRELIYQIETMLRQVYRQRHIPYDTSWDDMLMHAANYASDTDIANARQELEKIKHLAETQPSINEYLLNAESRTELVRLMRQGRLITQGTGGLLPEQDDRFFGTVLDLACGPGQWILDLLEERPAIVGTGVDISQRFISFAQEQSQRRKLDGRTQFHVMDITQRLAFPDASFDMVNARMLHGFLSRDAWLPLLREARRVLRAGGVLRLTEDEYPETSSAAITRLGRQYARAFQQTGKSFSPTGESIGIQMHLMPLLRQAGFTHVRSRASTIDISTPPEPTTPDYHAMMFANLKTAFDEGQPFLTKLGISTQEEQNDLYGQFLEEMQSPTFTGLWSFLTAWGEKS